MVVLLSLVLGVVLLYFWLIGHWFARVVACPILIAMFLVIVFFIGAAHRGDHSPMDLFVRWSALAACIPAGWFASGIPMWHWQKRARVLSRGLQL